MNQYRFAPRTTIGLYHGRVVVGIPSSASPHAAAPLRPAVLPAERANFDSEDAPFLDPSRADGSFTRRD